jgi:hypothetical protein
MLRLSFQQRLDDVEVCTATFHQYMHGETSSGEPVGGYIRDYLLDTRKLSVHVPVSPMKDFAVFVVALTPSSGEHIVVRRSGAEAQVADLVEIIVPDRLAAARLARGLADIIRECGEHP